MREKWKDIPGWEGLYQLSDFGRVRSFDRYVPTNSANRMQLRKGKILRLAVRYRANRNTPIMHVSLSDGTRKYTFSVMKGLREIWGSTIPYLTVIHANRTPACVGIYDEEAD